MEDSLPNLSLFWSNLFMYQNISAQFAVYFDPIVHVYQTFRLGNSSTRMLSLPQAHFSFLFCLFRHKVLLINHFRLIHSSTWTYICFTFWILVLFCGLQGLTDSFPWLSPTKSFILSLSQLWPHRVKTIAPLGVLVSTWFTV